MLDRKVRERLSGKFHFTFILLKKIRFLRIVCRDKRTYNPCLLELNKKNSAKP